jgi:hypothetical protein
VHPVLDRVSGPRASEAFRPLHVIRADPDDRDIVDEWGQQSFPASEPPQNWKNMVFDVDSGAFHPYPRGPVNVRLPS